MNRQQRLVLLISILASFVAFLDGSVVNVGLPAIIHELHGGLIVQQWVVDAYLITLGSLMLVAGSFSDVFGRRKVMATGLAGFAVTSLLCAFAPTASFLIVARGLQGIAGALLVPSSLALIISTFSGRGQGKAIGTWTAWTGIAFVVGPLLGGFLIDVASWRLIFGINLLPIAVTLWLMKALTSRDSSEVPAGSIDWTGAILCVLGLGGAVYGLIEQAHYGWSSPVVLAPLVLGLLIFFVFLAYEKRAKNPMLSFKLFAVRNFSIGNIATTAIYAGLSVSTFLVIIFIQQVEGYSALRAGLAMLPVTLVMFFLSPRVGGLASKYGPRLFMATGPLLGAAGFLLMLRVSHPLSYWTQLFPGVMLFGLGLSTTVAPLTSAVLGSIPARQAGMGSAINNAISRVAGLLAIACTGAIVGSTLNLHGFRRGVIAIALFLIAGGVVSAIGITNSSPASAAELPIE